MRLAIWTQWDDLIVPSGFEKLSPKNFPLESSDLSKVNFYVPTYMSGKAGLEYTRQMTNLKFLQMPNAGFEDAMPYVKNGITLCNARGVHDDSTAELAVGLAIAARRGFSDFTKAQSVRRMVTS
jgi:lactate dehydrogenase-like 2-hydroxyacid dehydrogenase